MTWLRQGALLFFHIFRADALNECPQGEECPECSRQIKGYQWLRYGKAVPLEGISDILLAFKGSALSEFGWTNNY